jgi:hypothetical protein
MKGAIMETIAEKISVINGNGAAVETVTVIGFVKTNKPSETFRGGDPSNTVLPGLDDLGETAERFDPREIAVMNLGIGLEPIAARAPPKAQRTHSDEGVGI